MLPSEPVTVTSVALAAVTVKVDAPPAETEVGLAEMLTEGRLCAVLVVTPPPHPAAISTKENAPNLKESSLRRVLDRCATGKAFLLSVALHSAQFNRFPR